jgi:hypothetical protein
MECPATLLLEINAAAKSDLNFVSFSLNKIICGRVGTAEAEGFHARAHPRPPVAASPSQEFRLHHPVRRRRSFGREFREKQSSVPQYQQRRINRVDAKNQADDRNVQGDALHQS